MNHRKNVFNMNDLPKQIKFTSTKNIYVTNVGTKNRFL